MAAGHPTPPTSSLPPLPRLANYTLAQVTTAIDNLRSIYCPAVLAALPQPKALPKHLVHYTSVPDSGYASEDEDCDEDEDKDADEFDIDVLRSDSFEREFAIRWLTGFDQATLERHLEQETTFQGFFAEAELNPHAELITGSVCGVKVQEVEMQVEIYEVK